MRLLLALFFSFLFFTASAQFSIVGNAYATTASPNCSFSDTCFVLTPNLTWQTGAVWHSQQFDLSQPFDGIFCLYMGYANTNFMCGDDTEDDGADGFAFVLKGLNAASFGSAGGDLGYVGINPSVSIEFDTYPNPGTFADLSSDHTALVINGNLSNPAQGPYPLVPSGANVEDGNYHTARLIWEPSTFELSMYFDNVLRFTHTQDLMNTVFNGDSLINWGFTSSTGGCTNHQEICFPNVDLDLPDIVEVCIGDSVLLSYNHNNLNDYLWQNPNGDTIIYWDINTGLPLTDTSFYASQPGYYTLMVTQNNAIKIDSVNLNINNPMVNLGNDTTFCSGDTFVLDASLPNHNYLWSDNSTDSILRIHQSGTYWVELSSSNLPTCTAQDTIQVTVVNTPIINFGNDTTFCLGEDILLDATNNDAAYLWSDNSVNPTLNVDQSGIYWVQVTSNILSSCIDVDSITITVADTPSVNLGNDTSFCQGFNFTLDATNPNSSYLWSNNTINPMLTITTSGTYWVEVKNNDLATCNALDTVQITVLDTPSVNFGDDLVICEGPYLLEVDPPDSATIILWQDGSTFEEFLADTSGTYQVTMTNICGTSTDEISIEFIGIDFCNCQIFVPNTFTPNGDRINDNITPAISCILEEYKFEVFNRWGEKVFESNTVGESWNGSHEGSFCQDGIYPFIISYRSFGEPFSKKKGHINLFR